MKTELKQSLESNDFFAIALDTPSIPEWIQLKGSWSPDVTNGFTSAHRHKQLTDSLRVNEVFLT